MRGRRVRRNLNGARVLVAGATGVLGGALTAEPAGRAALGIMRPGSVIAAFTGVIAERPQAGMADSSASKAAPSAWLGAACREARTVGMRVLDVRPGHLDTGFADRPARARPHRCLREATRTNSSLRSST